MSLTIDDRKYAIALANSGLTAGQAAERAGMSRQRFMMIINQKRATPQAVGKIANALGVSTEEIIETKN
ncbi:MAG: helix-turn-helix transcriptional regulator [Bariatricus sp.]|nr:helix-turn-helix transcriptional regulator [Bariatricus sp.]